MDCDADSQADDEGMNCDMKRLLLASIAVLSLSGCMVLPSSAGTSVAEYVPGDFTHPRDTSNDTVDGMPMSEYLAKSKRNIDRANAAERKNVREGRSTRDVYPGILPEGARAVPTGNGQWIIYFH